MKKLHVFHKINKSTTLKAILAAVLIVIVEIVCGILIYNLYAQSTYERTFVEYANRINELSEEIKLEKNMCVHESNYGRWQANCHLPFLIKKTFAADRLFGVMELLIGGSNPYVNFRGYR